MPHKPNYLPAFRTLRSLRGGFLACFSLAALPVSGAVDYLQEFTGSGNTSYTTFNWSAYLTKDNGDVVDWSNSTSPPAYVAPGNYAFFAPRMDGEFDGADGPGLIFTTDVGPCNLADLVSIVLDENMDASAGDPAKGRFAIRIGGQWYASNLEFTSMTEDGASGQFNTVSLSGISFTDGANWHELDVALGSSGGLSVAGSTVGGILNGTVDAFGVYAEPGNDGDHFRFDNFAVAADPTTATEIYLEDFPTPGGGNQNMASVGWSALLTENGAVVAYSQTGVGSTVGIANNGYGFFAPKADTDVSNHPGLVTTSEIGSVDISSLTSITWDASADNSDDEYRVAIEVGGIWYASAPALNDGQTDSGAGSFVPLGFAPASFPNASNWRIIENATVGDPDPLSLGAAPSSDLTGTVTAYGMYVVAGVDDEVDGDHVRFDNFTISAEFVLDDPEFKISSFTSVGGGAWEVALSGAPNTEYVFRSSTTLDFASGSLVGSLSQADPGDPGTLSESNDSVTTDGSGNATVQMTLSGSPADFVRAESAP